MLFQRGSISDDKSECPLPFIRFGSSCDFTDALKFSADSVFHETPCPTEINKNKDFNSRLDYYYKTITEQLIVYQSPTSGLFPIYGTKNCEQGHVRDNIYCAVAIWTMRQGYMKIDNDKGRTYELGQCAVKCMRGILNSWMKQAHKIEKFKVSQIPDNSLHTKFSIRNGMEIDDKMYGHLQIDCISLYLLYLSQMISSGLQIIYSPDEVSFVQNLIFYVERAYRTPDYGIWERGSKYNNNECELHASSIGMAKAALEALNGFDLYGDNGSSWSVVYVDIDAHNRNRTTLETLLPRESSSKNIDASAITVVGFPAFSVHDNQLVNKTVSKCIRRLKGNYGFKRFLRDGAFTVFENSEKRFYDASEIKNFEGIECEYPIINCFFIMYYIFTNNLTEAQAYYDATLKLVRKSVLPMYYYLRKDDVEAERAKPGSQARMPSPEVSTDSPHLWTQAIWLMCQLLIDHVVTIQDIDPIHRYLQPSERPRQSKRYSTFKGFYTDLTVNICCIAESVRLQQLLANYGIQTQTPHQIEPIEIWPPSELVKAYEVLGQNSKLLLTGRPTRPIGVLGTSKMYRVCSQRVICYPLTFETNDFYMSSDLSLLLDDVKNDLEFLSKCWKLQGRPIYLFLIREQNLRGPQRSEVLELLAQFKQGSVNGVSVHMDRLQTIVSSACVEHLDFLDTESSNIEFYALKELESDNTHYKSLSELPKEMNSVENTTSKLEDYHKSDINDLISIINTTTSRLQKAHVLHELLNRHGRNLQIDSSTVEEMLETLLGDAVNIQNWLTVRYCASVLHKTVDSLAPSITNILVRGKIITLGIYGQDEVDITKPLSPDQIKSILYAKIYTYDIYQAVLLQELIINLSKLISTSPELFNGIIKLRLGWILECMKQELEDSNGDFDEVLNIHALSPNEIKQLLYYILTCNNNPDRNIYRKRHLDGALNRVPNGFYEFIWSVLKKSPGGIKIKDYVLPQQPTLSDMTDYELNFSLKVEQMLSKIEEPVFRQIVVEMFVILHIILTRNPEYQFTEVIDIDKMVNQAIERYCIENKLQSGNKLAFYSAKPSIYSGTSAYLASVCIENLLNFTKQLTVPSDVQYNESNCKIS